jgi:serine protease AprX
LAPGVNLVDFRVLDQNGEGNDSTVILAINAAIYLKNVLNIRVINLSLGRPVFESYTQDPLCQAVETAWKAGIVVVVAAGNDGRDNTFGEQGYGTINAPANDPYVITVGAMKTEGTNTRTDDRMASYSSKGPTQIDHVVKPDLVAPGNFVVSLLADNSNLSKQYPQNSVLVSYYQSINGSSPVSKKYFTLSGTSMAAPVVSGAAADLLQANPNLTPDQVKLLLMQTAYKTFPGSSTVTDATGSYTDYYDILTVGAGYVDVAAALASINSVPAGATAMSPTANYDPFSGDVTLSYDPSSLWANQSLWGAKSLWGAQSLWGSSVLSDNKCLWGAQSIWGANSTSASKSLWGAQSLWGSKSLWGAETSSVDATNITINGEE